MLELICSRPVQISQQEVEAVALLSLSFLFFLLGRQLSLTVKRWTGKCVKGVNRVTGAHAGDSMTKKTDDWRRARHI